MPLASPPGRPDVIYGFGRIRLTLTADAWVMIARPGVEDVFVAVNMACVDAGPRTLLRYCHIYATTGLVAYQAIE
jgi:hypothetical protein